MSAVTQIHPDAGTLPSEWGPAYTEDDKQKVAEIYEWLNGGETGATRRRGKASIAKTAKIAPTTLNSVLNGKYLSSPTRWLDQALDALRRQDCRERTGVRETPFVETSVYKTAVAACHRAHIYRNFGVLSAYVGTGKTRAVKRYVASNANVILVEASPEMSASVLLTELVEKTGAVVHKSNRHSAGTKAERMYAVTKVLTGTDSLIILDEAETVTATTLEYLRRLSDKANVGVVLSGTEKLKPMIKDPRGQFGQISSRVGFWPPVIKSITEEDAIALTQAALEDDDVELTNDVLDAFWQMSTGSARVLTESLIPGVRDYGLRKGKSLTSDLIFKVGQDLLGYKRPRAQL